MDYCLYNAIKTPDGTILVCENGHDYRKYMDTVSKEEYMNDGTGYSVRRSINTVPYEDLSIGTESSPFEKVRTVKFWGSYGKNGDEPLKRMSLEEMEDGHLHAIIKTQTQMNKSLKEIFVKEVEYRVTNFKNKLDDELPVEKKVAKKKIKV